MARKLMKQTASPKAIRYQVKAGTKIAFSSFEGHTATRLTIRNQRTKKL